MRDKSKRSQLPGARKHAPEPVEVKEQPKVENIKTPISLAIPDMKTLITEAVNGVCLLHTATEILKVEHLKDAEVFGAASAYLAAQFRADTKPEAPPVPQDRSYEAESVQVKDEHGETGESGA